MLMALQTLRNPENVLAQGARVIWCSNRRGIAHTRCRVPVQSLAIAHVLWTSDGQQTLAIARARPRFGVPIGDIIREALRARALWGSYDT
jgi:hypothetical protein